MSMVPGAGASGQRAAPKSVSVGPERGKGSGGFLGRGGHSCLSFFLQHLPGLRPEHPDLGWIWILAIGRGDRSSKVGFRIEVNVGFGVRVGVRWTGS